MQLKLLKTTTNNMSEQSIQRKKRKKLFLAKLDEHILMFIDNAEVYAKLVEYKDVMSALSNKRFDTSNTRFMRYYVKRYKTVLNASVSYIDIDIERIDNSISQLAPFIREDNLKTLMKNM